MFRKRLVRWKRKCLGFKSAWAVESWITVSRADKILFVYLCVQWSLTSMFNGWANAWLYDSLVFNANTISTSSCPWSECSNRLHYINIICNHMLFPKRSTYTAYFVCKKVWPSYNVSELLYFIVSCFMYQVYLTMMDLQSTWLQHLLFSWKEWKLVLYGIV